MNPDYQILNDKKEMVFKIEKYHLVSVTCKFLILFLTLCILYRLQSTKATM